VIISIFGIFVIETKNMDGWIFGSADQNGWTQSFRKKRFRFQNPLRQNYRHTRSLAEFLKLDHDVFHSVVFFIGDCELKTPLPENVLTSGLPRYVKAFTIPILSPERVAEIEKRLLALKSDQTLNTANHLASLEARYGSETTCPKCGGELVKRVAKQGTRAGRSFFGCVGYPRCRYTRDALGC
jgi:restriction system protein